MREGEGEGCVDGGGGGGLPSARPRRAVLRSATAARACPAQRRRQPAAVCRQGRCRDCCPRRSAARCRRCRLTLAHSCLSTSFDMAVSPGRLGFSFQMSSGLGRKAWRPMRRRCMSERRARCRRCPHAAGSSFRFYFRLRRSQLSFWRQPSPARRCLGSDALAGRAAGRRARAAARALLCASTPTAWCAQQEGRPPAHLASPLPCLARRPDLWGPPMGPACPALHLHRDSTADDSAALALFVHTCVWFLPRAASTTTCPPPGPRWMPSWRPERPK